jgi:hypothetical protein
MDLFREFMLLFYVRIVPLKLSNLHQGPIANEVNGQRMGLMSPKITERKQKHRLESTTQPTCPSS